MKRLVASTGFAIAAGLLTAGLSATPSAAQEGAFMRNVLGALGIVEPEKPEIEYRERAPLALPPSMSTLPPPVDRESLASDPQWPNDPTVRARRDRETAGFFSGDSSRPLSVDELRAGRLPGAALTGRTMPLSDAEHARPLTPDELRSMDPRQFRTGEPAGLTRRSLSDPPSALLQPAPR